MTKTITRLTLLFLFVTPLLADGIFPGSINKQVNDWGDLLSSTQERQLEQALRNYEDKSSVEKLCQGHGVGKELQEYLHRNFFSSIL